MDNGHHMQQAVRVQCCIGLIIHKTRSQLYAIFFKTNINIRVRAISEFSCTVSTDQPEVSWVAR